FSLVGCFKNKILKNQWLMINYLFNYPKLPPLVIAEIIAFKGLQPRWTPWLPKLPFSEGGDGKWHWATSLQPLIDAESYGRAERS
ncbi:hypothetical protein, partial [Pseudomonas syringae]|uniref:hypothetical protein n=1 Tax=Pseudomonas syringae TaxID=317 RepID=UPI001E442C57